MKTKRAGTADAARRREPTVGQEAVSPRSRMRRLVRNQRFLPRHGRLNAALCLRAEGVATTKQRLDRAVGPEAAPGAQKLSQPLRFFNEIKSHPPALRLAGASRAVPPHHVHRRAQDGGRRGCPAR